jgi:hypothetical protein
MKTKTTVEKIAVISLGDVRDESWEHLARLGLDLILVLRTAGFKPEALSPYVADGGDVPLLILVKMKESRNELKKKIELLESLVGGVSEKANLVEGVYISVTIIDDESGYWWLED